jgi:hypothetical protein
LLEQDIISLQKQLVQAKYSSIHSPLTYIGGKRYHFIEQEISVGNILIHLPKEFSNLPPAIARQKYPSSDRPQCIKSSTDTSVNFAFSHLPNEVREDELLGFRNTALDGLKKIHPQNNYLDIGLNYWGAKKSWLFSWFEYTAPTLDTEAYSFNAFMRKDGRLLFYLFNCPKAEYENWRPIIFETISSIRDKPIDWKGDEQR